VRLVSLFFLFVYFISVRPVCVTGQTDIISIRTPVNSSL
jgi:hypothetical protein